MLSELRVCHLGVIRDQTVVLESGLTALTGETGAGKTLLVDAISLLVGAPAVSGLVAPGAAEARVEARFVVGGELGAALRAGTGGDPAGPAGRQGEGSGADTGAGDGGSDGDAGAADEIVLARVIPAAGRSRAYVDGRMVATAHLAEIGRHLVDIHGQNAHQTLLSPAAQRRAFDRAAGVDTGGLAAARRRVRDVAGALGSVGGDPRERARQVDLLRYQLAEIEAAAIGDPDEEAGLIAEEELLADAGGLVETAGAAWEGLAGEDGVVDRLGPLVSLTSGRRPLAGLHDRLHVLQEELSDVAGEARRLAETVEADPQRLTAIGERRRVLTELRRKYGPSLADVIDYRARAGSELDDLESHERRAAELAVELKEAQAGLEGELRRVWEARRAAAPALGQAVERELQSLAMPRARFAVEIGDDPSAESVTWLLSANPGQPLQPLAKVASGGELARAMLASRLVMGPAGRPGDGPETLVFDEVDAGIGGEAAAAVGRALAQVAASSQVLVVTHLAQVAACAGHQLSVAKAVETDGGGAETTVATARPVSGDERVAELARMLSGRPDSDSALRHAAELLEAAASPPPVGAELLEAALTATAPRPAAKAKRVAAPAAGPG